MIIVLGASGYIGSAFVQELARQRIPHRALSRAQVDYTDFRSLLALLAAGADTVINCAAFITKPTVELCDEHKEETLLGNTIFPAILRNACEVTNTKLLHVSTACIYQGDNGGKGWDEDDPPQISFRSHPAVYVGSKVLAEQIVGEYERAWICRIRIPFDSFDNPRNYLSKLMKFEKLYDDFNSLSHRGDFVKACVRMISWSVPFGIYNVTNWGAIWTHEIAEMIHAQVLPDKTFAYWDGQEFLTKIAKTVKSNCMLSIKKLEATGIRMRSVREAVKESLDHWTYNVPTS